MSDKTEPYYAREMAAFHYARHILGAMNIDRIIAEAEVMAHTTVYDFPTAIRRIAERKAHR